MSSVDNRSIRVDRVLQVFEKRGGNGEFTKPFDQLPDSIQSDLLAAATLNEEEVPILASVHSASSWVLLTCDRLLWTVADGVREVSWESIRDATIPVSSMAALRSKVKLENAILEVATDSGAVEVVIEPGKPFSGFWNVLKMVPALS